MDDADDNCSSRRGLGYSFFPPPVVIRSRAPPPASRSWHDDGEFAQAGHSRQPYAAPRPARESWAVWKDWNINPSGHGGRGSPPVFVRAENAYDELGRSVADGFGVEVEEGEEGEEVEDEGKLKGGAVADWYRSLASASASASASKAASPSPSPSPGTQAAPPEPSTFAPAASVAPSLAPSSAPISKPVAVRVHRSEWFIRRALLSSASVSASTSSPAPPPSSKPSSIGSMLNIDAARPAPAPLPRYALGPDNVGFSRLAALGWGGGGLGRPEGWTAEDEERLLRGRQERRDAMGREERGREERPRSAPREVDGVVDLTAETDSENAKGEEEEQEKEEKDDEEEEKGARSGPGRTAPIATALKFNRLGLGRIASEKRVTHSHREIDHARRRGVGTKHDPLSGKEPGKKAKIKWAERDRREREHRARIAAALR